MKTPRAFHDLDLRIPQLKQSFVPICLFVFLHQAWIRYLFHIMLSDLIHSSVFSTILLYYEYVCGNSSARHIKAAKYTYSVKIFFFFLKTCIRGLFSFLFICSFPHLYTCVLWCLYWKKLQISR
jgi:hypothetical protein